jgi:hypothetical protein
VLRYFSAFIYAGRVIQITKASDVSRYNGANAIETGQLQFIGKDKEGCEVYLETPADYYYGNRNAARQNPKYQTPTSSIIVRTEKYSSNKTYPCHF